MEQIIAAIKHSLLPQSSPEQKRAAREALKEAIDDLRKACNDHLAAKVVDTFVDITGPIMELRAAALSPLSECESVNTGP